MPQNVPYAPTAIFQPSLTVADLLLRSGQQQADAERRRGEISAQLWSGLGQTIAQIPQQIQQAKTQQLQQQGLQTRNALEGAQLTDVQQAQKFKTDLSTVLKNTPQVDEDGVSVWNVKDIANQLAAQGHGAFTGDVVKSLSGLNDSFRAEKAAKMAVVQRGAQEVARTGNDPTFAGHFLDQLEKNGSYPKETIQQYRDFIAADPANVAKLTAALSGQPKTTVVPEGASLVNDTTMQPVFKGEPKPPTETELALKAASGDPAKAIELLKKRAQNPANAQSESFLLDGKPVKGAFVPDAQGGKYLFNGEDVTARVKPIPPASMTINPAMVPSGDALDMAAKRYLATGELPSMGMGSAGAAARVAVMNAAAKIDPTASLAANKATYKADTTNLSNLQRTEGTLSAFENTAGKNLDQFLSLADKIPDTGVPWLNQPIRSVNAKGLGSADQAAFNAARDVALREIARVTNDPKLAGVLSDTARREVSGLSPADATFAQIQAVAKVLKQDMANVHAGINEQIGTVKAGLQNNPTAPAAPALVPTLRFNPATGKIEPISGR